KMTELWYRFNVFAERQFFGESKLIDGVIVPAHVLAYYEVSMSDFLKNTNLPFLVDPVSYVWNISVKLLKNENSELKKSYGKLVEKLDCKIGNLLGKYEIERVSFQKSDFDEFVERTLSFQLLDFGAKKPERLNSLEKLKERIRI